MKGPKENIVKGSFQRAYIVQLQILSHIPLFPKIHHTEIFSIALAVFPNMPCHASVEVLTLHCLSSFAMIDAAEILSLLPMLQPKYFPKLQS